MNGDTYLDELRKVLADDERLMNASGQLLKSKITELAQNLDTVLIGMLLKNRKLNGFFFKDIAGVKVLDLERFLEFVHNEAYFTDSYTAFKNKIGLATSRNDYVLERGQVVLNWPYKDCVLEGGQDKEDQKRDEVFWNETLGADQRDVLLAPKVLTAFKKYDEHGEHEVKELSERDNFIIRGNNLLALHTLKRRYVSQVKLVYIDPPYNTGNDGFNYNDRFNHSTWLTFMKNRLSIAKELLRDDGTIYVQCDSREQAYLKVLLDEIFKRENYLTTITVKSKAGGGVGQESYLFDVNEYIHVYSKTPGGAKNNIPFIERPLETNTTKVYNKILTIHDGTGRKLKDVSGGSVGSISIFEHTDFEIVKAKTEEDYFDNFETVFRTTNPQGGLMKRIMPEIPKKGVYSIEYIPTKGRSAGSLYRYYFHNGALIVWLKDSAVKNKKAKKVNKLVKNDNLWSENLHQGIALEGGVELLGGKKPEKILERIIKMATNLGDLVLDYHLGSGTTAATAHKMGRRYIGVEQLSYGSNDAVVRLQNVIKGDQTGISKSVGWEGGGSFVYAHLKNDVNVFIKEVEKAKDKKEVLSLLHTVLASNFLSHRVDPSKFEEEGFAKLYLAEQKHLLIDLVNKNKLYVNYHDIDDVSYKIDAITKKLNAWMQDTA